MTKDAFDEYVDSQLKHMEDDYIDLLSREVHERVGGYPSKDHRMPVCCDAMYNQMRADDTVMNSPPKGKGATLRIRYFKKNH